MKENARERHHKMAIGAFNLLESALVLLKIPVSGRYNALYGLDVVMHMLMAMCDGGLYAPTAKAKLTSIRKTPSTQWLLGKLRAVDRISMEANARQMIDFTVQALRKEGMLRKPITVAIDKTLIPYYGNHSDMTGRVYSKHDRGTSVFESYATAQCVDDACRAHLAARVVERGEFLAGIVRNLLEDLARNQIKVRRLLADREFFSIDIINTLNAMGVKYIMPAVKNKGIAAAIQEHIDGKRTAVSKYVMKSKPDKTEAEITLLIHKKRGAKDDSVDSYLVFATNLPRPLVAGMLVDLPKEYKKRWGIETGYRDVKKIRPMTTSKSLAVRVAYFFFALAVFNAWVMSRYWARRDSVRAARLLILISLAVYEARITVPRDRGKPS